MDKFSRQELIFGKDANEKLKNSYVAVFGLGGVGSYCVEALVRSGIGKIDIIDNDKISVSNINRQLYATTKTVDLFKTEIAKERCLEINPDLEITVYNTFFMPDTSAEFDFSKYDYVVDAIDTVTGKIEIIMCANKENVPIISCMGTGNKINPLMLEVADIYKTSVCPLAKVMRHEMKKRNIKKLKVVYSKENPITPKKSDEETNKRQTPGSSSFVPSVAGLIIAGEVIKDLTGISNK